MTHDGLTSSFDGRHMVEQASFVSRELGISREEQDSWALRSHQRAVHAQDEGFFDGEIVPVGDVAADEGPRRDTSIEALAKLKPVFDPEGTTTAGNAPGVNDGASCVVVCSEEFAKRRGLDPLATILAQGYVADEFAYLARTPAKAGKQALAKAGKSIDDVERIEVNEAFSSVALNSVKMLGADPDRANVNGGAVALGHPIGASGGRIVTTMINERSRNGGGRGSGVRPLGVCRRPSRRRKSDATTMHLLATRERSPARSGTPRPRAKAWRSRRRARSGPPRRWTLASGTCASSTFSSSARVRW